MVKVRHSEGAVIHTDPESCADAREGIGAALTGAHAGEVLSGESNPKKMTLHDPETLHVCMWPKTSILGSFGVAAIKAQ
jgi:hypothetical protein